MNNTRLHANENWYNPMPEIKDALLERLAQINLQMYPDPESTKLKAILSEYVGIKSDQLICTNGSDELIKIIFESFTKSGDAIVIHSPTFIEYTVMSDLRGCKTCAVEPNTDLTPDVDQIIQTAIDENAAITFICNPNNPTGYVFNYKDLTKIIESVPGIVVVDEAYVEFSQLSLIGKKYDQDKVIIMRTLSKAFGAAAIRVGYGVAKPELIQKMNLAKMPYNLSTIAQESAVVLLENQDKLTTVVKNIRHERMRAYGALLEIQETEKNFEVFPSYGNYLLLRSDRAKKIYNALEKAGYMVRIFEHDPNLENCLRFSITQNKTNTDVLNIIRRVVKNG